MLLTQNKVKTMQTHFRSVVMLTIMSKKRIHIVRASLAKQADASEDDCDGGGDGDGDE